jgi:hypothetical protein
MASLARLVIVLPFVAKSLAQINFLSAYKKRIAALQK